MDNPLIAPNQRPTPTKKGFAAYFGLTVEIIARLPNCNFVSL
jgi:hypothetical protein